MLFSAFYFVQSINCFAQRNPFPNVKNTLGYIEEIHFNTYGDYLNPPLVNDKFLYFINKNKELVVTTTDGKKSYVVDTNVKNFTFDNTHLYYAAKHGEGFNDQIYKSNLDGSNSQYLMDGVKAKTSPKIDYLLFQRLLTHSLGVAEVMQKETGNVYTLSQQPYSVVWEIEDGEFILYSGDRGSSKNALRYDNNLNYIPKKEIVNANYKYGGEAKGKKFYIKDYKALYSALYICNLDNTNEQKLSNTSVINCIVVNNKVIYLQLDDISQGIDGGIYIMDADEKNSKYLFKADKFDFFTFPSGSIVGVSDDSDIYVVDDYVYFIGITIYRDDKKHNIHTYSCDQLYAETLCRIKLDGSGFERIAVGDTNLVKGKSTGIGMKIVGSNAKYIYVQIYNNEKGAHLYSHEITKHNKQAEMKEKDIEKIYPTASKTLVAGKAIEFEVYNINNSNYFKLRDLAYVLDGSSKMCNIQ